MFATVMTSLLPQASGTNPSPKKKSRCADGFEISVTAHTATMSRPEDILYGILKCVGET